MILSENQIEIPENKILNYLLQKKEKNDKSSFLNKLGFTEENYTELIHEIKNIATSNELVLSKESEFGDLYKIVGTLRSKQIVTIWVEQIELNKFRFVTLYPANN